MGGAETGDKIMNANELALKLVADVMEVSGPYDHCTAEYFRAQLAGFKAVSRALGLAKPPFDVDTANEAAEIAAERIRAYVCDAG